MAVLMALAGCGGAESPSAPAGNPSAPAGSPTASAAGSGESASALDPNAPCSLLTRNELATVFDDGVPEHKETPYGGGFAECLWEDSADQHVRLSIVPLDNLKSDYLDQLTARDEVVGLGEGSVTYSGTVGIGHAKRGGITAAFSAADVGVLLAVKTGDGTDEKADLIQVTVLGQRLLSRAR